MDSTSNADLHRVKTRLLRGMHGFMESYEEDGEELPYTVAHIERCTAILDAYVAKLGGATGDAGRIMEAVREAILQLNDLNEEVESLIETDQREDICEFIDIAARAAGLEIEAGEDITEEWREW